MIDYIHEFDLIRPYCGEEINAAVKRLITYPEFDAVLSFLYPGEDLKSVKNNLLEIKTSDEFQHRFMYRAVSHILNKTTKGLTVSGVENIDPHKDYLFISNHRDIVLDAAILQLILLDHGHKTSQITFGSNLMSTPAVVDFGKLNKMFKFYRTGTRAEMYKYSMVHSAYITNVIKNLRESVWIAQRSGRTKDGNDMTQVALIKMLACTNRDTQTAIKDLNILPVSVSYEFEPCDDLKARETYLSSISTYVKKKDEDINSILTGILSPKGKVHFSFGTPINVLLQKYQPDSVKTIFEQVASEIDKQVHTSYHLFPGNYIAFDMLNNKPVFKQHYTAAQYAHFNEYIQKKSGCTEIGPDIMRERLLKIYATPVSNKYKYASQDFLTTSQLHKI